MINPTLEFLYKLHNRGIKLGLENIESFLNVCDNPHQKINSRELESNLLGGILTKYMMVYGKT